MKEPIKIGVSSCLLGVPVRYDGGHRLEGCLKETLGRFIQWLPVCPEFDCGMSVPRDPIRLVNDSGVLHLISIRNGADHTALMMQWLAGKIKDIEEEGLCGFVLKARSPSCGIRDVNIHDKMGVVIGRGAGIFTEAVKKNCPLIPLEDEERMRNIDSRENFLHRVFVYRRWRNCIERGIDPSVLMQFHREHKLLMLAHSPEHYRRLGRLIAGHKQYKLKELTETYINLMMEGLRRIATVNRHVNVLQHIMGYFKRDIDTKDKQVIMDVIEEYRQGRLPLLVPLTLLNYYANRYESCYLKEQVYLNLTDTELLIMNHG